MKLPLYIGIFLSKAERAKLLRDFPPVYENVFADHVTLIFKPKESDLSNYPLGTIVRLKVVGYAQDQNGSAVVVDLPSEIKKLSQRSPHITISTAPGTKPVYSNKLISKPSNVERVSPKTYEGILDGFPRQNKLASAERVADEWLRSKVADKQHQLWNKGARYTRDGGERWLQDQSLIRRIAHQWLRAKDDKVKVRRKDTGKVVWVSRENAKSSDYEPVKDEDSKSDGKKSVKPPKHPSGWRDGADEPELTADNAAEWAESHTVTTPGGSQMFGTTHPDMSDEKDAGTSMVRDHIVPQALETARQAIKDGKKVVFIAEGSRQEDLDADEDYNEHHAVAKALNDEFGDKVQQDTWDDDPVNVFSEKSPVWKELAEAAGDETGAHVGISVMLVGQGDDPDELREAGILTPEAEAAIKKNMGIDMSKSLSDDDKEKLYRASFPADFGDAVNDISTLTDIYNGARQRNLMSKIEKAEAEGAVAISTAGGTHVWNLGPILSGKKASVSRIARNWLRSKVADVLD